MTFPSGYCRFRMEIKCIPVDIDTTDLFFTAFLFVFMSQPSSKQQLGYGNKANGKAVIHGPAVSGLIGIVSTQKGQELLWYHGYVIIERQSYEIPTDSAVGLLPLSLEERNVSSSCSQGLPLLATCLLSEFPPVSRWHLLYTLSNWYRVKKSHYVALPCIDRSQGLCIYLVNMQAMHCNDTLWLCLLFVVRNLPEKVACPDDVLTICVMWNNEKLP